MTSDQAVIIINENHLPFTARKYGDTPFDIAVFIDGAPHEFVLRPTMHTVIVVGDAHLSIVASELEEDNSYELKITLESGAIRNLRISEFGSKRSSVRPAPMLTIDELAAG